MEYATVDEAKAVFDKEENVILDGRVIYIDYATRGIDEKPRNSVCHPNKLLYCSKTFQMISLQEEMVYHLLLCL